jgi:thioredoxin 2
LGIEGQRTIRQFFYSAIRQFDNLDLLFTGSERIMDNSRSYFYRCAGCGTKNRIAPEMLGKTGKCGKCGGALPTRELLSGKTVMVTDANFETEVLQSPIPVLVYAWATWCPTCSQTAPIIQAFAQEARGRVRVGKLNVDPNPSLSARFDIRSVPFLLIFDKGRLVESMPGGLPKHALMMKMGKYI